MAKKKNQIQWLPKVEDHDYPAATSYLSLLYPPAQVTRLIAQLRKAPVKQFKAKDLFRASQLSLLGVSNSHVDSDRAKIKAGAALCPLLLVRDSAHGRVVIADGYHRLCAVYQVEEACGRD